ncbi:MAG: DUF433 domain-containing protein [Bacteroidia bacterium]|nr:DUF433 domain-containing protein [Bacteroidia bacterium]MDW8058434.1 DUF433 domain-containing protein [Bacteroidia bacterium]
MPRARIVSTPTVLGGKPRIAGTRLSVQLILEELAQGKSSDELLSAYPTLTPEGLQAVFQYLLRHGKRLLTYAPSKRTSKKSKTSASEKVS